MPDERVVKDLPQIIKFDKNIYDQLIQIEGLEYELLLPEDEQWTIENKIREDYWFIMKPLINKILKEILEKNQLNLNINYPVIHFRCSDVPFTRQPYYHFEKYSFYKDSLAELRETIEFDKVILLSCTSHNNGHNNCNIYILSLKEYIETLGYEVILQCNDEYNDFATIFYAPGILATSSSYSFMSGFFSDGIFISSGHYCEEKNIKCYNCKSWLKHNNTLEHADVPDYNDTEYVINKLKE
jgi:hypothetical protein